ncbi:hypothetical protein PR048_006164 [Dryococelus australis]|uniref:Uncharacterized protein n=1 Tax=Dryococelus australis TaxID=614101 RepID=A0ABQ9IA68_9NEOP|nr:hypothetical protein PR048_006164 [Dryococelus australis]
MAERLQASGMTKTLPRGTVTQQPEHTFSLLPPEMSSDTWWLTCEPSRSAELARVEDGVRLIIHSMIDSHAALYKKLRKKPLTRKGSQLPLRIRSNAGTHILAWDSNPGPPEFIARPLNNNATEVIRGHEVKVKDQGYGSELTVKVKVIRHWLPRWWMGDDYQDGGHLPRCRSLTKMEVAYQDGGRLPRSWNGEKKGVGGRGTGVGRPVHVHAYSPRREWQQRLLGDPGQGPHVSTQGALPGIATGRFVHLERKRGATVTERIARSPPTKTNRVQSPVGSPDFRKWESCRTMPVGRRFFFRGTPVSPALTILRRSILTSIAPIGFQDLVVKSCQNIFTHLNIPEKTRRPATSSGTIPTCEKPGANSPGMESVSPWWEASSLITKPPRPPWEGVEREVKAVYDRVSTFEINF